MGYKKIGTIDDISEIPFNKNVIVSGRVDKTGWMWQMGGVFGKGGDKIVFVDNEIGMAREVKEEEISLNVLEKIR